MTTKLSVLRRHVQDLKNQYDDITRCKKEWYDIAITYAQLEYKSEQDTQRFINECKEFNNSIIELKNELIKKIDDNSEFLDLGYCQYEGHCQYCADRKNDNTYCYDDCVRCGYIRKYHNKHEEHECKEYFYENICQTSKILARNQCKNIININNNLTVKINNYIHTKDLFFYVTITSSQDNANERLRYIFTFLMCGCYARNIFPNEPKYSKALTFPVLAAKYNIVANKNQQILHGVLRYERVKSTIMTVKKLEGMGGDGVIVKAHVPTINSNNKYSISKNDIDYFVDIVSNSEYGSKIDNFYLQDR